eukprot:gene1466-1939_t
MSGQNKKGSNVSERSHASNPIAHQGGFTGRISAHFIAQEWNEALDLLEAMRVAKQSPKLGALQRWTREADLAPADLRFPLIDAVLRVVALAGDYTPAPPASLHQTPHQASSSSIESVTTNSNDKDTTTQTPVKRHITSSNIRIVTTQMASDRPSNTDLNMYAITPPGAFVLKGDGVNE